MEGRKCRCLGLTGNRKCHGWGLVRSPSGHRPQMQQVAASRRELTQPAGRHLGQHRGNSLHQPGGCRPRLSAVAPEPHGLSGPQDTCPQPVARQEESHVLGQRHQVSGAALGPGPREVVSAWCLQDHLGRPVREPGPARGGGAGHRTLTQGTQLAAGREAGQPAGWGAQVGLSPPTVHGAGDGLGVWVPCAHTLCASECVRAL